MLAQIGPDVAARRALETADIKRPDADAIKDLKAKNPDAFKETGIRRFCNLVSKARGQARKAALIDALKRSHGN